MAQLHPVSLLQGKEEFEKTQKELLEKGNIMRQGKGQLELQQVRAPGLTASWHRRLESLFCELSLRGSPDPLPHNCPMCQRDLCRLLSVIVAGILAHAEKCESKKKPLTLGGGRQALGLVSIPAPALEGASIRG